MLKKCISLWMVICLLMVAASNHQEHESNSGGTGQSPVILAIN